MALVVLTRTQITSTGRAASSDPAPARYLNIAELCRGKTASGVSDYTGVLGIKRRALQIVTGAGGAGTLRIEGSFDEENWATMAYGGPSLGGYIIEDMTLSVGGSQIVWLPPEDWVLYVRVNLVTSTLVGGVTVTLYGMEE